MKMLRQFAGSIEQRGWAGGLLFCVVCILISGCSTTEVVSSATEINQKMGKHPATVRLRSGEEYECRAVRVSPDSTRFIEVGKKDTVRLPTQRMESVCIAHHGGGALEGLIFGGLGGGVVGFALGSGTHDALVTYGSFMIGGIGGSVAGFVYGAIKGHEYTFVLPDSGLSLGSSDTNALKATSVSQQDLGVGKTKALTSDKGHWLALRAGSIAANGGIAAGWIGLAGFEGRFARNWSIPLEFQVFRDISYEREWYMLGGGLKFRIPLSRSTTNVSVEVGMSTYLIGPIYHYAAGLSTEFSTGCRSACR